MHSLDFTPSPWIEKLYVSCSCSIMCQLFMILESQMPIMDTNYICPVKYAVFPLMEKDEKMADLAREITLKLKKQGINVEYDGSGNIGKRYRRQDEIGTPYCITIDHQTLEDGTVTIRHRDSMEQKRIAIEKISEYR